MADNGEGPTLTPQMRAAIKIAIDRRDTARSEYAEKHNDQTARKLRMAQDHLDNGKFVEALWNRVFLLESYTTYVDEALRRNWQPCNFGDWLAQRGNEERESSG